MSAFILSSNKDQKKIIKYEAKNGYEFNPKNKTGRIIKVKKIKVYDKQALEKLLAKKYVIKYSRLVNIIKDVLESDDSEDSDGLMCLNEIIRLKEILETKYKNFLKKELYAKFLDDLIYLEGYIRQMFFEQVYEEEKVEEIKMGR